MPGSRHYPSSSKFLVICIQRSQDKKRNIGSASHKNRKGPLSLFINLASNKSSRTTPEGLGLATKHYNAWKLLINRFSKCSRSRSDNEKVRWANATTYERRKHRGPIFHRWNDLLEFTYGRNRVLETARIELTTYISSIIVNYQN